MTVEIIERISGLRYEGQRQGAMQHWHVTEPPNSACSSMRPNYSSLS